MTIWPPTRAELTRPAYRALARRMVAAIEAGVLEAGAQLPTHRALAYDLGLSVQTVSRAYEELRRMGLISGEVGRGSYVRAARGDVPLPWQRLAQGEAVIDCSMLVPVTGEIHAAKMAEALEALAGDLPAGALFSFRPRATLEAHCAQAARWLAGCGLDVAPGRIVPTNGSTAAMTLALQTAAVPGDLVVTEALGHHTLKALTATLGLRLEGLDIDGEGVLPEAFERACRAGPVKALYVMPAGLGPGCAVMGPERRAALAAIAARHGVWIVENDAWGPLAPERAPPIAALAPERVFYFTGLTKCLLPGLRVGWLVAPEAAIASARTRHMVTNWMATPLMAEIATRWIADGTARTLLRWQRRQLAARVRVAADRLAGLPVRSTPHGMHVWLDLPGLWDEDAFVAHARHEGVAVAAGANFAIGPGPRGPGIRICIGAGSESDIARGVSTIARLARSAPEPALLAL